MLNLSSRRRIHTVLTNILVDLEVLANNFDLGVGVLDQRDKTLLDGLHLLRHGTEDALLESIKLVKATPRPDLTQSHKDSAHGLEVEGLVTAENKDEATKLDPECFDGFRLAC